MKKIIAGILLSFFTMVSYGQEADADSLLNLLNAPANPAFNLMGISPASIDRPTDLNSFRLSVQNATNNFSKLPTSYAVEFSPAVLAAKHSQTLKQFNSQKFADVFRQSFSLSIGMVQATGADDGDSEDSVAFTKIGFGAKFSLIRPKWNSSTSKKVDTFYMLLKKENDLFVSNVAEYIDKNPEVINLQKRMVLNPDSAAVLIKMLANKRSELLKQMNEEIKKTGEEKDAKKEEIAKDLKAYTKALKIEREGGFLDFACGMVVDFPDNRFNNSQVAKGGAWLTGGYENGHKGISALGIARLLFQPDKIFADETGKIATNNISTFDAGGKLAFEALQGKFTFSTEAIYRSVLTKNTIKPSWRAVANLEYDLGLKNQKITLAIGRNFDGTVTKDGTLIAAINFIKGFGGQKAKL